MEKIIMDGVTYHLRIVFESLTRSFELLSGKNQGTNILGRELRDLIGTGYSYSMDVQPDPNYPTDYDDFYQAISEPVDVHEITLPYGQTTMTFDAKVSSGQDVFAGTLAGVKRWKNLTVNFDYIQPQRVS